MTTKQQIDWQIERWLFSFIGLIIRCIIAIGYLYNTINIATQLMFLQTVAIKIASIWAQDFSLLNLVNEKRVISYESDNSIIISVRILPITGASLKPWPVDDSGEYKLIHSCVTCSNIHTCIYCHDNVRVLWMSINDIITIRSSLLRDTKLYAAMVIDNNTNHYRLL